MSTGGAVTFGSENP